MQDREELTFCSSGHEAALGKILNCQKIFLCFDFVSFHSFLSPSLSIFMPSAPLSHPVPTNYADYPLSGQMLIPHAAGGYLDTEKRNLL